MLIQQKFVSQVRDAKNSDYGGTESVRLLRHKILIPLVLSHGEAWNVCARRRKRIGLIPLPKAVTEIQYVTLRKVVIHTYAELIRIPGQDLCADIGERTGIGQRIERQQVL